MTTSALPDVFRKAADIIGERGWTQGSDIHPETGGVCANGALRLACGAKVGTAANGNYRMWAADGAEQGPYLLAMRNAHKVLNERLDTAEPNEYLDLLVAHMPRAIWFNDKVATSGSQVQAAFRDAADWLEAHPLAELASIEDQPVPFAVTQAGYQALDNKDLVNA